MKNKPLNIVLFLFVAVLSVLFFFGGPDYYSTRSFKASWNLGHIIYYTLVIFILLRQLDYPKRKSILPQLLLIILCTILSGILIEWIQVGLHRKPELGDVWRDVLGSAVGWIFFSEHAAAIKKKQQRFLRVFVAVLIGIEFINPVRSLSDEIIAGAEFPVLSDFETPFELERWEGEGKMIYANDPVYQGKRAARVSLTTEKYSGIAAKYFPRD